MSSSDWYARKLGQNAPSPYTRTSTPPSRPPAPARIEQVPQHTRDQQPEVQVTADNVAEAAALWHGGQGTKSETENCPNCGSHLFFSRSNGTGEAGGSGSKVFTQAGTASVAARCFSCGYSPTMPMQTGSMS